MRIGITGATGLIGSAFGKLAATHGHELVAFTRAPQRTTLPWASEVRPIDTRAKLPLDAWGLDVLVHLAGESIMGLWTAAKKKRIRDSRVDLTQRIVRCLAEPSPRPAALISASGVGIYGSRSNEVLTESSQHGADFLADICVEWEAAAQRAEQLGLRVVTLRTGLVLAKEGGLLPLMRTAFSFALGGRLGSGAQWMPWIHLQDEVRLILWAVENRQVSGPLNLSAPHPVTNAEFTTLLARAVHRPAIFHAPAFLLKQLPGGFGNMILGSQRAVPDKALASGFQFDHPDLAPALQNVLAQ
ncbi:MAG: TIGR01777 family oxidoreductase [Verrucomicrobiaceae bacterium]